MSTDQDETQAPDDAEANAKWGFKSGRTGMATETKIGLLLILVLLGAFGFVVYKKMDQRPSDGLDTVKAHHHGKDDGKDPFELDEAPKPSKGKGAEPFEEFANHGGKKHDDAVHAAIQDHNHAHGKDMKQTEPAPDPFAATNAADVFKNDTKPKPVKQAPPPTQSAQADPFPPANSPSPKGVKAQTIAADPFGAPAVANWGQDDKSKPAGTKITPEKVATKKAPSPPDEFNPLDDSPPGKTFVTDKDNEDLNAFDANIDRSNQRVEVLPNPTEVGVHKHAGKAKDGMTGDATWDDGGQVVTQRERNKQKEVPTPAKGGKKGRFGNDDFPETLPDNNFNADNTWDEKPKGKPGKQHHHPDVEAPRPLEGDPPEVYVVESGDNYWHISKKKYGTARYFTALARFNEERIPDPKAMRPGMKVLCPTPHQLEHCFPHLCPRDSQVTQVGGTSDDCHPGLRPGFYVEQSGQPMYRVGDNDTLTEIAKRHLGRSTRWIQVFQLNKDILAGPNNLKIGMELRLPADASQVELVQEPVEFR